MKIAQSVKARKLSSGSIGKIAERLKDYVPPHKNVIDLYKRAKEQVSGGM